MSEWPMSLPMLTAAKLKNHDGAGLPARNVNFDCQKSISFKQTFHGWFV